MHTAFQIADISTKAINKVDVWNPLLDLAQTKSPTGRGQSHEKENIAANDKDRPNCSVARSEDASIPNDQLTQPIRSAIANQDAADSGQEGPAMNCEHGNDPEEESTSAQESVSSQFESGSGIHERAASANGFVSEIYSPPRATQALKRVKV